MMILLKLENYIKGTEMIEVERLNGITNRSDVENRKKYLKNF